MFNTDPTANDEDLFDLAAKLAGCAPIDLLKVRSDPAGLVVILATGQKFVFALDMPELGATIRTQLAAVLGQDLPPAAPPAAPAPADKAPKAKKVR